MFSSLPLELLSRLYKDLSYSQSMNLALTCSACKEAYYADKRQRDKRAVREWLLKHKGSWRRPDQVHAEPGDVFLRQDLGPVVTRYTYVAAVLLSLHSKISLDAGKARQETGCQCTAKTGFRS